MFELITKKRNNLEKNKKGFTLVEVIVVLVILAILAAILVPAMIGWINKANEKTAVVEGRTVLLALQTVSSDTYNTKATDTNKTDLVDGNLASSEKAVRQDVADLTEIENVTTGERVTDIVVRNGKVTRFTYKNADFTVKYDASKNKKFVISKGGYSS